MHGVIHPHVQNLAFPFVEMTDVPVYSVIQQIRVPLDGCTPKCCINHSSPFCIGCKPAQSIPCPTTQAINKDAKQYRPRYQPLGYTIGDWFSCSSFPLLTKPSSAHFWSTSLSLPGLYFIGLLIRMLWDTASRVLLELKMNTPSSTLPIISSQKAIKLIKRDLPSINLCWLLLTTFCPSRV